jgi:hypothetical protein
VEVVRRADKTKLGEETPPTTYDLPPTVLGKENQEFRLPGRIQVKGPSSLWKAIRSAPWLELMWEPVECAVL